MSENRLQNGFKEEMDSKTAQMNRLIRINESILTDFHQIRYIRWHQNNESFKVNSIDFNPNGEHMIVSSDDKTVRIYDMNGEDLSVIPSKKHGSDCVQFVNDSNTAIFASKYEANNGSDYHKIRHLDLNRNYFLHYYVGHEKQVTSIAINRNHNCFLSASLDNTIRLWDCRLSSSRKLGDRQAFGVLKCSRSVATFDPQGVVFAVSMQSDSSVRLYDMRNYAKGPFKVTKFEPDSMIGDTHGLRFSPNGRMIAVSTNGVKMRVIDSFSLNEISQVFGMNNELRVNLELCWSPDSQYLFSGSSSSFAQPGNYGNLNMFNALDGTLIKTWKTMHESFTRIVRFNPVYYFIALACHDISYWCPTKDTIESSIV